MTSAQATDLLTALAEDLGGVDPHARLVSPHVLRRVVKEHYRLGGFGLSVPHTHGLVLPRGALQTLRAAEELHLPSGAAGDPVLLLAEPEESALEAGRRRWLWQRLYELGVEGAVAARVAAGELTAPALRARIHRIGQTEFDEIRAVIREQDRWLPVAPGAPRDGAAYAAFCGAFHALWRFEPARLARWFPSLAHRAEDVAHVLAADVDAERWLRDTRPAGAASGEASAPAPPGAEALDAPAGSASLRPRVADLAQRLAALTAPDGPSEAAWRDALGPLGPRATRGFARAESRFLYDLRRACRARERPAEQVDLVEWARSLGRRAIRRPLPLDPWLAPCRRLRAASRWVPRLRLDPGARGALQAVMREAARLEERRFRAAFEETVLPRLAAGMGGDATVEHLARGRLVAELADRALQRGFVSYAELRDAIARSDARLADVPGPVAYLHGDALLRTDRALRESAEGVYRAGEIYLRGLQRLAAPLFGTRLGRGLSLGLLLPVAGAFVILEGLQHLLGPLWAWLADVRVHLTSLVGVAGLALLLALLMNVPRVRRGVFDGVRWLFGGLWRGVRGAVAAVARILREWPPLARLLNSRFVVRLADGVGRVWRRFRYRLLPGLLRAILDLFDWLVMSVERVLYTVDQGLRFRPGQSRIMVALKAVVGLGWGGVAYVVRFYVSLLIEPQVNPVKHFPVVTVSHKIILPMSFTITELVRTPLAPLGPVIANTIAVSTVFLLPGVFGFLAWELKANWKLYQANRPPDVSPAMVGHHGETVARLLRPGFHSGTLPKLFAKHRRVARRDARRGDDRSRRKLDVEHHHLEEALRRFAERELLAVWLTRSPEAGSGPRISLEAIHLSSNRIELELGAPAVSVRARVTLEEHSGWLVGSFRAGGLLAAWPADLRPAFLAAVAGLLARAGVDLVRERIEAALPEGVPYDVAKEGLVVWPGEGYAVEAVYPLTGTARLTPRLDAAAPLSLPPLDRAALFAPPLPWDTWRDAWEPEGAAIRASLATVWAPRVA